MANKVQIYEKEMFFFLVNINDTLLFLVWHISVCALIHIEYVLFLHEPQMAFITERNLQIYTLLRHENG